jgi:hypothetical protein
MKEKIYAEIGFGNDSLLSTEIEKGKKECRINKFLKPKKIKGYYLRFWIFKKVFILSTINGFKIMDKSSNKLKILFGIQGEN